MVTVDPSSLGPDPAGGPPPGAGGAAPLDTVGPYSVQAVIRGDHLETVCVALGPDGTRVELHVLRRADATEVLEELQDLAEAYGEVLHPGLVRPLGAGVDPERPDLAYLVVEHVPGRTLDELLSSSTDRIEKDRVMRWADQLAGALDRLHDHALVHGAIGPGTVIIDDRDQAHLAGAGFAAELARLGPGRSEREILLGEGPRDEEGPGEADASGDIAALAATLYQALGGTRPAEPHQAPPVPGRSVQINLALLAAMSRDRAARPQRARELVQSLHGAPVRQAFVAPAPPARLRRIGAGSLVGVAALVILALGVWLWNRPSSPPSRAARPQRLAEPAAPPRDVQAVLPRERIGDGGAAEPAAPAVDPRGEPGVITLGGEAPELTGGPPATLLAARERAHNARQAARVRRMEDNQAALESVRLADRLLDQARDYERSGRYEAAEAAYRGAADACGQAFGHDLAAWLWTAVSRGSSGGWR